MTHALGKDKTMPKLVRDERFDKKEFRAGKRSQLFEEPFKNFRVTGCDKLNLREKPSKTARVMKILNKGDIVAGVVTTGLDWKRVTYISGDKALDGYCMSEFLEEVVDEPVDSDND